MGPGYVLHLAKVAGSWGGGGYFFVLVMRAISNRTTMFSIAIVIERVSYALISSPSFGKIPQASAVSIGTEGPGPPWKANRQPYQIICFQQGTLWQRPPLCDRNIAEGRFPFITYAGVCQTPAQPFSCSNFAINATSASIPSGGMAL